MMDVMKKFIAALTFAIVFLATMWLSMEWL